MRKANPGDIRRGAEVYFEDPDCGLASGWGWVTGAQHIPPDPDSVIRLQMVDEAEIECFWHELSVKDAARYDPRLKNGAKVLASFRLDKLLGCRDASIVLADRGDDDCPQYVTWHVNHGPLDGIEDGDAVWGHYHKGDGDGYRNAVEDYIERIRRSL